MSGEPGDGSRSKRRRRSQDTVDFKVDASSQGEGSTSRPKRIVACLHCRRQKLKCDGTLQKPCTRCKDDGVECVIRPRSNAAILSDDLRWQQSVEMRLHDISRELFEVKANNESLRRHISMTTTATPQSITEPIEVPNNSCQMPTGFTGHLYRLREALEQPFGRLQNDSRLSATVEEAAVLWEFFYDTLAIYHGFIPSPQVTSPSPLLLAAITAAAAKRCPDQTVSDRDVWVALFDRALLRLLSETREKTWDDVVGLCIARTWFWKADGATSGLIYGCFMTTLSPQLADMRGRRVWDFLQITTISHAALYLESPIVPERHPPGVLPRVPTHVLFGALTELFDILGVMHRGLTTAMGLVEAMLRNTGAIGLTYAETTVLRSCRSEIERWGGKWLTAIHDTPDERLPACKSKGFLIILVTIYYRASALIVDGYLRQGSDEALPQFQTTSREMLSLMVDTWADSLGSWPTMLIQPGLIAALAIPAEDPLCQRAQALLLPISHLLDQSTQRIFRRVTEKVNQARSPGRSSSVSQPTSYPTLTGLADVSDAFSAIYNGSDAFWSDLHGIFGLQQTTPNMSSDQQLPHQHQGMGPPPMTDGVVGGMTTSSVGSQGEWVEVPMGWNGHAT